VIGFLHTAQAHVDTFGGIVRGIDPEVRVVHRVEPPLLADARRDGGITPRNRAAIHATVEELAGQGARVVVCTCSTIGGVAEAASVPARVRVLRVDRPMAIEAVQAGSRLLVVATLASTLPATVALLREVALGLGRPVTLRELVCEMAFARFEAGDHLGYAAEIARAVEDASSEVDAVVLAQASMTNAADRLLSLGIPVLTSARSGVIAALAALDLGSGPVSGGQPTRE
jgi:hypothetical protein